MASSLTTMAIAQPATTVKGPGGSSLYGTKLVVRNQVAVRANIRYFYMFFWLLHLKFIYELGYDIANCFIKVCWSCGC